MWGVCVCVCQAANSRRGCRPACVGALVSGRGDVQEKLAFRDRFGPGTEMPWLMREERGELTPEELEELEEDSDEEMMMDVDTLFANDALSFHIG